MGLLITKNTKTICSRATIRNANQTLRNVTFTRIGFTIFPFLRQMLQKSASFNEFHTQKRVIIGFEILH